VPRPRSVISPPLPSRAKPKVEVVAEWQPRPGIAYRVRQTNYDGAKPGVSIYSDDLFDIEMQAAEWEAEGIPCMVEQAVRGAYRPLPEVTA